MNKIFLKSFAGIICLFLCSSYASAIINDPIADELKNQSLEPPDAHLIYNYQDTTKIPIKLSLTTPIKDENDVYDGQNVAFRVLNNVVYEGNLIIKRGTIISARVQTTISSGMNGIPAYIVFDDFKFEGVAPGKISGVVQAAGLDRSLWVFPLKWALTPLPPTGSLTNFIKGGHVKVKNDAVFVLYYHPHWL